MKGRRELNQRAFEFLFQHEKQNELMNKWAQENHIRRVVIADFSKNIFATWMACRMNGIEVVGVFDRHAAFAGMKYRGIPIINSIRNINADGIVLSNINPAQVTPRMTIIKQAFSGPVLQLWESQRCPITSDAGTQRVAVPLSRSVVCAT